MHSVIGIRLRLDAAGTLHTTRANFESSRNVESLSLTLDVPPRSDPDFAVWRAAAAKALAEPIERIVLLSPQDVFEDDFVFWILGHFRVATAPIIAVTTDAVALHEPRRRRFLRYGPSQLVVRMDAATPELYAAMHGRDVFHRVIESVRGYARDRDPSRQQMGLVAHVNLMNLNQIPPLQTLARQLGVPVDIRYGDAMSPSSLHACRTMTAAERPTEAAVRVTDYIPVAERMNLGLREVVGRCLDPLPWSFPLL